MPTIKQLAAVSLVLILMVLPQVFAAAPTKVDQADTSVIVWLPSTSTYIKFGATAWFDAAQYMSDHANFTNFATPAASNPARSFGLGVTNGNVSITKIYVNDARVTVTATGTPTVFVFYYFLAGQIPGAVNVTTGSTTRGIGAGSYFTTLAAFNAAAAPAVYWNSGSNYLEAKAVYASPTVMDFAAIVVGLVTYIPEVQNNPWYALVIFLGLSGIGLVALQIKRRGEPRLS